MQHRPKAGAMFASLNPHHRTRSLQAEAASAMKVDEELRRAAASYSGAIGNAAANSTRWRTN